MPAENPEQAWQGGRHPLQVRNLCNPRKLFSAVPIPRDPTLRFIRRRQAIALRQVCALARQHQVADRVVAGQAPGQHMVDLGCAFRDAHAGLEAAAIL